MIVVERRAPHAGSDIEEADMTALFEGQRTHARRKDVGLLFDDGIVEEVGRRIGFLFESGVVPLQFLIQDLEQVGRLLAMSGPRSQRENRGTSSDGHETSGYQNVVRPNAACATEIALVWPLC